MLAVTLSAISLSVAALSVSSSGALADVAGAGAVMPDPAVEFAASQSVADETTPSRDGGAIQDVSPSDDPDAAPSDDPVWAYFLGKTSFIFYHDLASALLQRFDLSYSGKKTAAVDQLTAMLLVAEGGRRYGSIPVLDAVLGWLDSWHQAARDDAQAAETSGTEPQTDTDLPATWAAQNISAARLTQIACLVYGSAPQARSVLRDSGILDADQLRDCPADYTKTKERWSRSLRDAKVVWREARSSAQASDDTASPQPASLTLEYRSAGSGTSGDIVGWLHDVGLFDAMIGDLNQDLTLPAPIKVVLDQCGTATTSFDADSGSLRVCYELLQSVYDAAATQNVEAPPE